MAIDLTGNPSFGTPNQFETVTPHDTNDLAHVCAAIYVGTGGHVAAVSYLNNTVYLFKNVPSGSYLFGGFRRVNTTNTTAQDMIAVRSAA